MKKLTLVILLMATEGLSAQWIRNDTGLDCSLSAAEDIYLKPGNPVLVPKLIPGANISFPVLCTRRDTKRSGAMVIEELDGQVPQDGYNRHITCPWYDANCTLHKPQLNFEGSTWSERNE